MAPETYDALVIGGGPAGLTAALYLGRARRSVLVVDRGDPRHAVSAGVHNCLTRDGFPPASLREVAWQQMAAYPTVAHRDADVASLRRADDRWIAQTADGARIAARAVLLATGVIDEHPDIAGYRERWGHAIHHCPFCHGWEMRDRPLAVLGQDEAVGHLAPLLRGWTDDVVVLAHGGDLPAEVRAHLGELSIPIHDAPVVSLDGPGRQLSEVRLADGTTLARSGLFVISGQRQVPLVASLGVALNDAGYVSVDAMQATSLPMLWAAGDLTSRMQQVVVAAAQGAGAGAMMAKALIG